MAVAAHDGPQADPEARGPARGCRGEDRGLAARCAQDARPSPESAAQTPVALHPPLRRRLERSESAVLRRPADGSQLPASVWRRPALTQGDGEPLDAARADVGCRACAPCRSRVLSLAEHGALLRLDLGKPDEVGEGVPRERRSKLRQFLAQKVVDDLRVGLALRFLHHLADEETEQALLAPFVRGDLAGILGEDAIDDWLQ